MENSPFFGNCFRDNRDLNRRDNGEIVRYGEIREAYLPSIRESIMPRFKKETFTFVISMVEIVMFFFTLVIGQAFYGGMFVRTNMMAGPTAACLKAMGGTFTPEICEGRLDRLVSPIILHAGIKHIASNLFFQLHFGFTLEERWSSMRFAIIYFVTGIGCSLLSTVANKNTISVGASGALFGIIGANCTFIIMNWKKIPNAKRELCCMLMMVAFNFMWGGASSSRDASSTKSEKNIDQWGHFGGLLTGWLCGMWATPIDYVAWEISNIRIFQLTGIVLNVLFFGILLLVLWAPGGICS